MLKSSKTIIINRTALKALIAAVVFFVGIILLIIITLSTYNKQPQLNPLAYLEGSYRYDHNETPKPNSLFISGGSAEWYLKLEANGRCYSNIPIFGKTIGLCYWEQSDRNDNYICVSRPPQGLPINGEMYNNEGEIICAEYGEDYINLLSMILRKE